ncbi:MAG: GTPase ObgE [Patescibacteria group bacterium]|nr:GTPase ObgE [Patescibacteria group bacterium]
MALLLTHLLFYLDEGIKMIDYVEIKLKGGNGGRGAVSFMTMKGKAYGPPSGGDGGKGGSVYLVSSDDQNTLLEFRFKKVFKADDGQAGREANKTGESGQNLYVKVPVGTIAYEVIHGARRLLADFTKKNQTVLVAKGGNRGRGNAHLKPSRTGPSLDWEEYRRFEEGEPGEEKTLVLELKLLADVGLVGLPNAGKSTLLSVITSAKPKIADYPFTTIEPNLGVAKIQDYEFVVADIPGLIEGASQGKGLGDQFLRHVERTRLLVHVISTESAQPLKDYRVIRQELSHYNQALVEKPEIVVLNKTDVINEVDLSRVISIFSTRKIKVIPISAATGAGLDILKKELLKQIRRFKVEPIVELC